MIRKFNGVLFIPPFICLIIASGVVYSQTARHNRIVEDLRVAKAEAVRLERMLPEGETAPAHSAEDCKDEHHTHSR